MFNDVAVLISKTSAGVNEIGDISYQETKRQVFVRVSSIGLKRKMEAMASGLTLAWKLTLSDVAEYKDEEVIEYKGARYNIVNVYITDNNEVDLTLARY